MPKTVRSSARYTLAVASVAAAALVRAAMAHWLGAFFPSVNFPFVTFYLAVILTTWFAGFGPGMVSIALGYLAADLFFVPGPALRMDPLGVFVYFTVTLTIVLLGQSMHHSRRQAEASLNEARRRQRDLEQEIAHRKQVEEALRLAQLKMREHSIELEKQVAERTVKLTETIHSLEGFCYSIAHDLRAPIRAMQGYATVLGEDCTLGTTARDYTHRIGRAALRMAQLVQDLLIYGRLTHEPVERGPVHLEAVVDHVVAHLSEEIAGKKAAVKIQRPLPQAMGHPAVLEQVLANLLRNAMTFLAPGNLPQIFIHGEQINGSIRLYIEDNGIGIPQQHYERIFNVFERLHPSEKYPGTGIGLAIVKKGVERMGGHVGVTSDPGKGSSFWIELDCVPAVHLPPANPELKL